MNGRDGSQSRRDCRPTSSDPSPLSPPLSTDPRPSPVRRLFHGVLRNPRPGRTPRFDPKIVSTRLPVWSSRVRLPLSVLGTGVPQRSDYPLSRGRISLEGRGTPLGRGQTSTSATQTRLTPSPPPVSRKDKRRGTFQGSSGSNPGDLLGQGTVQLLDRPRDVH